MSWHMLLRRMTTCSRDIVKLAGACLFKSARLNIFVLNFYQRQKLIPDTTKHTQVEQGMCHETG